MKIYKFFLVLLMSVFAAAGCQEKDILPEVKVGFRAEEYTMIIGETGFDLAAELKVRNSEAAPQFTSSNESVVSLKGTIATAHAAGQAEITATVGDVSAKCVVKVQDIKARKLTLTAPELLTVGVEGKLVAAFEPEEYNPANLEWKCVSQPEGNAVLTKVDETNYTIKFNEFKEKGYAEVTVKDKVSSLSKTVKVTVRDIVQAYSVTVSPESLTVTEGDEPYQLSVSCLPEDYDTYVLTWASSNEAVATVSEGLVTFTGVGTADITATDPVSGKSGKCTVTVNEKVEADAVIKYISVDPSQVYKQVGDPAFQITATCKTESGEVVEGYSDLVWTATKDTDGSSEYDVVSVDQRGLVTILAEGISTVTVADSKNTSVKATCMVTIKAADIHVETVLLSPSEKAMKIGDTFTITAQVLPEDATDKSLVYTSENEEVATVSENGTVKALALGETVITATAKSGKTGTCKVIVSEDGTGGSGEHIDIESVVLQGENGETDFYQLETFQITAFYVPSGATPKETSWTSSDESVATVDENGLVTAVWTERLDEGKTKSVKITHVADEKTATINLTLNQARVKEVVITSEPEGKKINYGDSFTYTAKVEPALASQEVVWNLVDSEGTPIMAGIGYYDGLFKSGSSYQANGVGTYTITATAHNTNVKAYTTVEVVPVEIESATIDKTQVDLTVGQTVSLHVTINPSNATYKSITWSSDKESVATVSQDGIVTAVAEGTAVVTAELSNGLKLECTVNVASDGGAAKVGDYYYSDGTWSTSLDESKTVVGIVFSIDNATLDDTVLAADHPSCKHGLVVALDEIAGIQWGETGNLVAQTSESMILGYSNTKSLEAHEAAATFTILDGLASKSDCEGTSGWYVPSIHELGLLYESMSAVNASIANLSDATALNSVTTYYWSSTEYRASYAYRMKFSDGSRQGSGAWKNEAKTYSSSSWGSYNTTVRYVFAF